jgi:hypothetical protein
MRTLDKLRLRFTSLFRRRNVEAQLEDELHFHEVFVCPYSSFSA